MIKSALEYTRADSGASVEKARGVVIGIVSTLMGQGESFSSAMTTVCCNLPRGYRLSAIPKDWQDFEHLPGKWVVVENTPGYLPDNDPAQFYALQPAQEYAHDLADELRESGYKVWGNKRDGYYGELHDNDLGRVIEIMEGEAV